MVKPADRDGVLVGDLPSERARLGETNVMRFARNSAADNARLCRHVSAVELVTQPDGLGARRRCRARRTGGRTIGAGSTSAERVVSDVCSPPNATGFSVGSRSWLRLWSRRSRREPARAFPRSQLRQDSMIASLTRKHTSTRSASRSESVFLRTRFLCTQSAASSGVLQPLEVSHEPVAQRRGIFGRERDPLPAGEACLFERCGAWSS